jgi:putative ABC transport system ATP-binding protein
MESIVAVRGLSHEFGAGSARRRVLKDVSLELQRGEVALLTGRSGSGKTTLLTLLGGMRSLQRGSVQVLGEELRGIQPARLCSVRRKIRFVFQSNNLLRCLNVADNVRVALESDGSFARMDSQRRSAEVLQSVGLGNLLQQMPNQISVGEQQRVAIARALASNPVLLLADEPTAALDREASLAVASLISKLAREHGCTVLVATHDERIYGMADTRFTIDDGEVCRACHESSLAQRA